MIQSAGVEQRLVIRVFSLNPIVAVYRFTRMS
jgi:hypothetical protein